MHFFFRERKVNSKRVKGQRLSILIVALFLGFTAGCDQIQKLLPSSKKEPGAPESTSQNQKIQHASFSRPVTLAKDELARVGDWTITLPQFKERLNNLKNVRFISYTNNKRS